MPERVALAAQADGWWVRSRIIWNKANPMPESVSDRPTDSHEHIWMFTKSQDYFWDCEAVRENVTGTAHHRGNGVHPKAAEHGSGIKANESFSAAVRDLVSSRQLRNVWSFATQPYSGAHFATFPEELPRTCIRAATSQYGACSQCGAPWERILEPSEEYAKCLGKGFHDHKDDEILGQRVKTKMNAEYVTEGWKPTCGCGGIRADDLQMIGTPTGTGEAEDPSQELGRKGFERPRNENEGRRFITRYEQRAYAKQLKGSPHRALMERQAGKDAFAHYLRFDVTGARPIPPDLLVSWIGLGWLSVVVPPDFTKWPAVRPCLVVDPFGGSGTTGQVAVSLNRNAIMLDLAYTHSYGELARQRTSEVQRELML